MEIKCKNYPISITYLSNTQIKKTPTPVCVYYPNRGTGIENKNAKIRPITAKKIIGLSAIVNTFSNVFSHIKAAATTYKKNVEHTYEHKVIFSIIEKELYGKNSINSITHDMDKMLLYLLGFPKRFVSKFHRKHSKHHIESGKNLNLKSMLVDNIASSPEFKPEKKLSLRNYYNSSIELQEIPEFKEILEKYNFGENLNFERIKRLKSMKLEGTKGFMRNIVKLFALLFIH